MALHASSLENRQDHPQAVAPCRVVGASSPRWDKCYVSGCHPEWLRHMLDPTRTHQDGSRWDVASVQCQKDSIEEKHSSIAVNSAAWSTYSFVLLHCQMNLQYRHYPHSKHTCFGSPSQLSGQFCNGHPYQDVYYKSWAKGPGFALQRPSKTFGVQCTKRNFDQPWSRTRARSNVSEFCCETAVWCRVINLIALGSFHVVSLIPGKPAEINENLISNKMFV